MSIFGNILVAHHVFVHFITNLHIAPIYAVKVFLNLLIKGYNRGCNVFLPQFHGLYIQNGHSEIVPKNLRHRISKYGQLTVPSNLSQRNFFSTFL